MFVGDGRAQLTALVQLWTWSLAERTTAATNVNSVARVSRTTRTNGMAKLSTKAATSP